MPIDEKMRPYMEDMRMLDRDRDGREKLVGLTFEESEWYLAYLDDRFPTDGAEVHRADENRYEYSELYNKHELHRLALIIAEKEAALVPTKN